MDPEYYWRALANSEKLISREVRYGKETKKSGKRFQKRQITMSTALSLSNDRSRVTRY